MISVQNVPTGVSEIRVTYRVGGVFVERSFWTSLEPTDLQGRPVSWPLEVSALEALGPDGSVVTGFQSYDPSRNDYSPVLTIREPGDYVYDFRDSGFYTGESFLPTGVLPITPGPEGLPQAQEEAPPPKQDITQSPIFLVIIGVVGGIMAAGFILGKGKR